MKRFTLVLAVFAIVGIANAEMLINGDFEAGAGVGWSQWWGGNSEVGAPDPIEGDLCGGVWWWDDGIVQGMAIGPGTYTVSGQLSQEDLGFNRIGVIQAEVGDGVYIWWVQRIVITQSDTAGTWLSGSTVIDNTAAGATWLNINLCMIDLDGGGTGAGIVRYDNISVLPEPASLALLGLGILLLKCRSS